MNEEGLERRRQYREAMRERGLRSTHEQHHRRPGIYNPKCAYCQEAGQWAIENFTAPRARRPGEGKTLDEELAPSTA